MSIFEEQCPGFFTRLKTTLPCEELHALAIAYTETIQQAGREHFLLIRPAGQSFNPRPARIAQLALEADEWFSPTPNSLNSIVSGDSMSTVKTFLGSADKAVQIVERSFRQHLKQKDLWNCRYNLPAKGLMLWQLADILDTARHLNRLAGDVTARSVVALHMLRIASELKAASDTSAPMVRLIVKIEHSLSLQSNGENL